MRIFCLSFSLVFPVVAIAMPHPSSVPTVALSAQGKVSGIAAGRAKAIDAQMQILENEDCAVRSLSSTEIQVADRCGYLGGIYRYISDPNGDGNKHEVVLGFSLTRKPPASQVWMVSQPLFLPFSP